LFHVDRQTGGQMVAFHNFAITPKKGIKVTDYVTLHYGEMVT